MMATSPDQLQLSPDQALFDASAHAYETLVSQGYPEGTVHRTSLCFDAAALMVERLTASGGAAEHEIYASPHAGEHSYVSLTGPNGEETIGDPTWQQFLPPNARTEGLPTMLVGSREVVTSQAQAFGVRPEALEFWRGSLAKRTPAQQSTANEVATHAADAAAEAGLWEKFMDTTEQALGEEKSSRLRRFFRTSR